MNHNDIANRIAEWLESVEWPYYISENNDRIYLAMESGETGLSAYVQIRLSDDGRYRVYAVWPDEIGSDMDSLVEYVSKCAASDYEYGRLKVSEEDLTVFYVSDVFINDISELTDEILDMTITGTALCITEKYGPDLVRFSEESI